jgi:hypothetical protein
MKLPMDIKRYKDSHGYEKQRFLDSQQDGQKGSPRLSKKHIPKKF